MPQRISILGERFGRVVVVAERDDTGELLGATANRQVKIRCDCGEVKTTSARSVRRGHTVSCGCAQRDACRTHGLSGHPLYAVHKAMVARCHQPAAVMYPCYGARGIRVCEEWRADPAVFIEWGGANGYRPGLAIDRIDVNGNYEPSNCRFVTTVQNARNKRDNRVVTYSGRNLTVADLAEESGVAYDTLYQRIAKLGWSIERAAETPVRSLRRAPA